MRPTAEPERATATACAILVAKALEAASDELCRLDAVAGDGDHGLSMAGAARSSRTALEKDPRNDMAQVLHIMACEFGIVGGAMGALSYVMLEAVSQTAGAIHAELKASDVVSFLYAAQRSVSEFGGARPGDKTVVDAIAAAHRSACASAESGASALSCLQAEAQGAREGAEATAMMTARVGRSSRLGEMSVGSVDPGARSFAIALSAVADWFEGRSQYEPTEPTEPT
jgi:dihydroxyacetone kinase